MKQGYTIEEFEAKFGKPKRSYTIEEFEAKFGKPKRKGKKHGVMNTLERAFANAILEPRRLAGESKAWTYCESEDKDKDIRFFIGNFVVTKNGKTRRYDLYYTPDFEEVQNDGSLVYYEVKGYNWAAAFLRFKVAVSQYPQHPFFFVERLRNRWVMVEYRGITKGEKENAL
jgi:hypothetical protein